MHIFQSFGLFACAIAPLALAIPKEMNIPSPINLNQTEGAAHTPSQVVNDLKGLAQNGTSALPNTDDLAFYNGPAPKQVGKSCDGQMQCHSTKRSCKEAADRYENDVIYDRYTSYVKTHGVLNDRRCTAIFECKNGKYGRGLSGRQIKEAFNRIWSTKKEDGKHCKHCGTSDLEIDCRVRVDYCFRCTNVNTDISKLAFVGGLMKVPALAVKNGGVQKPEKGKPAKDPKQAAATNKDAKPVKANGGT